MGTWISSLFALSSSIFFLSTHPLLDNYRKTGQQFDHVAQALAPQKRLPTFSVQKEKQIINQLTDEKQYLSYNYQPEDFSAVISLCTATNHILNIYYYQRIDELPLVIKGEDIEKQLARNIKDYQTEIEALQGFYLRCLARATSLTNHYLSSKDKGKVEAKQKQIILFRDMINNIYKNIIIQLDEKSALPLVYRYQLSQLLAQVSPILAPSLPLNVRKGIYQSLLSLKKEYNPIAYTNVINKIALEVNSDSCDFICHN